MSYRAFFEAFNTHPLVPLANVDDRTRTRRQNFLEKVVENIGVGTNNSRADSQEHRKCWNLAMELTQGWELDGNSLKLLVSFCSFIFYFLKEITMLYEFGFDSEAEKLIPNFEKPKLLLAELLPLIAGRVKHLLDENPDLNLKAFQYSAASEK